MSHVIASLLVVVLVSSSEVEGFILKSPTPLAATMTKATCSVLQHGNKNRRTPSIYSPSSKTFSASYSSLTDSAQSQSPKQQDDNGSSLSKEEWKIISELHAKAETAAMNNNEVNDNNPSSSTTFQSVVEQTLPNLSPSLILKLRSGNSGLKDDGNNNSADIQKFQDIAQAMQQMLNNYLASARNTLAELMNAGEIKKLDALIGKAARAKQLDVAFFQVLQMNMQDAAMAELQQDEESDSASRLQILQHIYTRCQEEVEKTINPGIALLNMLLRTEADSIRRNQLQHYLCPQPAAITTPDGKEIPLKNASAQKTLVDHQDFCQAIANAVQQIRTIEKAGGTDRTTAAGMVESCRQVAKEARVVIGEEFGRESKQLLTFEEALMPVFRPSSPDSPYIQGS